MRGLNVGLGFKRSPLRICRPSESAGTLTSAWHVRIFRLSADPCEFPKNGNRAAVGGYPGARHPLPRAPLANCDPIACRKSLRFASPHGEHCPAPSKLLSDYSRIEDWELRKVVIDLARALARAGASVQPRSLKMRIHAYLRWYPANFKYQISTDGVSIHLRTKRQTVVCCLVK